MKSHIIFSIIISSIFAFSVPVLSYAAATTTDIAALQRTLEKLQAESDRLTLAQTASSGAVSELPFTHSFGYRATDAKTGGEVSRLQKLLLRDKATYPEGLVTGFFGKATEKALQRFQAKNKIVTSGSPATTGYGWVGKKTRDALNKELTTGARATGALSVTAAPNINASKVLTKSAIYTNTFSTKFVGAGNGTKVTFSQTGMPVGVTVSSGLSCIAPCSVENKVTVAPGVSEGVYPINVKAVSGKESATGVYLIQIGEARKFVFELTARPTNITDPKTGAISNSTTVKKSLTGQTSVTNEITVRTVSGDPQPVTLTQQTNEKGITFSNLGTCTPPCAKRNSAQVGFDVPSGQYSVTVIGVGGGSTSTVNYTISVGYNDEFGFHISNADKDKQITVTQPVSASSVTSVPLRFILDGGSPTVATVTLGKMPDGISASISSCVLPCEQSLVITVNPSVKIGTFAVPFTVEATYPDKVTGEAKTLKKTYTQSVKVILGNAGVVL